MDLSSSCWSIILLEYLPTFCMQDILLYTSIGLTSYLWWYFCHLALFVRAMDIQQHKSLQNVDLMQAPKAAICARVCTVTNVATEEAPRQSSFGLAFTASEFAALKKKIDQQRRHRRRGENGGMKLFSWLRIDKEISGDELEKWIRMIYREVEIHQEQARLGIADPGLDGHIFNFAVDLGVICRLANTYSEIDLKSFTVIKEKLLLHKNAIVTLLNDEVEPEHRHQLFAFLYRDSIELRETIQLVRRHLKRMVDNSSAVYDSDDMNTDTDTDGELSDGDVGEHDGENENESENARDSDDEFEWWMTLVSEEERIGN